MKTYIPIILFFAIVGYMGSWLTPDYTREGKKVIVNDTDTMTIRFERKFPAWTKIPVSVSVQYKDKEGKFQQEEFSIGLTKPLEEEN
jgi:hypothetical protein